MRERIGTLLLVVLLVFSAAMTAQGKCETVETALPLASECTDAEQKMDQERPEAEQSKKENVRQDETAQASPAENPVEGGKENNTKDVSLESPLEEEPSPAALPAVEEAEERGKEDGSEENGQHETGKTEEREEDEAPDRIPSEENAGVNSDISAEEQTPSPAENESDEETEKGSEAGQISEDKEINGSAQTVSEKNSEQEETPVSSLSKATGLKLTSSSLSEITLSFQGDTEPTRYRVYRATSKSGKYTYLGYAWEPKTGTGSYLYEDATARKGITYYYKVRAIILTDGKSQWGAEYSSVVSGTPLPSDVGKVTGHSRSVSEITVSWNAVKGASGYQIARSTDLYSGYKVLSAAVAASRTVFIDKQAKVGNQYYYCVRAYYDRQNGSGRVYGPYTYSSVVLCEPAAPKGFAIKKYTDSAVMLTWTPEKGVNYYNIKYSWQEAGKTQSETVVGIGQARSEYTVKDLKPGQKLTFQIQSIAITARGDEMRSGVAECTLTMPGGEEKGAADSDKTNMNGEDTDETAGTESEDKTPEEEPLFPGEENEPLIEKEPLTASPEITRLEVTSDGIRLIWNESPGAESYRVERSTKQNSGYRTLAQKITESGFLDMNATMGQGYYYRVTALDGKGTELKSASKGVFAALPLQLTAKKGSDGYYTFTWPLQKNADYYRIFRSKDGEAYTLMKTISGAASRSWKDSGVSAGCTYSYYVQALKTVDGMRLAGEKGTIRSFYIGVKENPAIQVTQGPSSITVTWEKVENASGYVIYGAIGDANLKRLGIVSGTVTSWSQSPPAASGYLTYYVRAYTTVGRKNYYAPSSGSVTIRRMAAPQVMVSRGPEGNTACVEWSEVPEAQSYRVHYRRNPEEAYQYVETRERRAVIPAEGGKTLSVFVQAVSMEGENVFLGSRSAVKSYTPYWKYALLIGNSQYIAKSSLPRLAATAADVAGFSVVLDQRNGWKVNACANMTGPEILSSISRFYAASDENCTCLFYYSGHGLQGHNEMTGSLCGIDGSYVSLSQLKSALKQVPGKSIVLMDSCGSGAAVENDSGAPTLKEEKFSVITSSAAYETSYTNPFHSYFTYYLSFGSGYDYDRKKILQTQPADANGDGNISFQEISAYIARYLSSVSTLTDRLPEPDAPIY